MIYLASSSPRRAELLAQIGVKFKILRVDIDESAADQESARRLATRLSRQKAEQARQQLGNMQPDDLILAADTLISLEGEILGKPQSCADCEAMLSSLSARQHQVISAVALIDAQGEMTQSCTSNEIVFRSLTTGEIRQYCRSGEPLDKAGSYAIQGFAAIFIEHLSGSYSSVMGLPLFETAQLLQQAGYALKLDSDFT